MSTDPAAPIDIYANIRTVLRRWFEESGLSLNKWAKQSKVSGNYPIQVLDGVIATPALDKLQLLCAGMGKTLWDLLKEADPEGARIFTISATQDSPSENSQLGVDVDIDAEQMILRQLIRIEHMQQQVADEIKTQEFAIVQAVDRLNSKLNTLMIFDTAASASHSNLVSGRRVR
jgi:hypothetical protein